MVKKTSKKSLLDAYQFDNFRTDKVAKGRFGDKAALVLSLARRSKKVCAPNVASGTGVGTTARSRRSGICRAATAAFIWSSTSGAFAVERLAW
jgi:hypothetical protein